MTAEAVTVGEGVTITDVEQTGEYTAILTFSGVAPDGTITAIKGESKATVNADYQFSADRTQAEVLFENRLQADTYTITFTPEVGDPSDITTTFEVARLAKIEFPTGVAVAQSLSDIKVVKVAVMGLDQFGSEIDVPNDTKFTFSKGISIDAVGSPSTFKDGALTIVADATGTAATPDGNPDGWPQAANGGDVQADDAESYTTSDYFQLGGLTPLVVTAVWTDGEGHAANGTGQLTIESTSCVETMVFGEIATDDTTLQGKPITRKNLEKGNYYVPFEAVDQYGLEVSGDDLEKARAAGTVFVSPDSSSKTGFTAYAGNETLSADNKTEIVFGVKTIDNVDTSVMYISAGRSPLRAGTVDFNIIPAGGSAQKWSLDVEADQDIDTLDVPKVALQEHEDTALEITAYDPNGDEIDQWYYQPEQQINGDGGTLTWALADDAIYKTTLTYTNSVIKIYKDATAKTITYAIRPVDGKNSVTTVMWSTAGQKTGSWTSTVAAPASVEGINTDNVIRYTIPGNAIDLTGNGKDGSKAVKFVDSNGTKINAAVGGFGQGEKLTGKKSKYTWKVTPTSDNAVYAPGTVDRINYDTATVASGAMVGAFTAAADMKITNVLSVKVGTEEYKVAQGNETPSPTNKIVKVELDGDTFGNTANLTFGAAISGATPVTLVYANKQQNIPTWWTNSDQTSEYKFKGFTLDDQGKATAFLTNVDGTEITKNISDTVTIHLYKITASDTAGLGENCKIQEIAKKNVTLTVVPAEDVDYSLSVSNKLYTAKGNAVATANINNNDNANKTIAKVSVSGTYNGEKVAMTTPEMDVDTVTITSGAIAYVEDALVVDAKKTTLQRDGAAAATAANVVCYTNDAADLDAGTATISGSVIAGTVAKRVSATIEFDKTDRVGTTLNPKLNGCEDLSLMLNEGKTGFERNLYWDSQNATVKSKGGIFILDQYGEYVTVNPKIIGYTHVDRDGNKTKVDLDTDPIIDDPGAADKLDTIAEGARIGEAENNDNFTISYASGLVSATYSVNVTTISGTAEGNDLAVAYNAAYDESHAPTVGIVWGA